MNDYKPNINSNFARADRLLAIRKAFNSNECDPTLSRDLFSELLTLAIDAHDSESLLDGGEIINFGGLCNRVNIMAQCQSACHEIAAGNLDGENDEQFAKRCVNAARRAMDNPFS